VSIRLPIFFSIVLAGIAALGCAAFAAERPPNIVLVVGDDLGWGDPRCYNPDSRIPTPSMDRLSSEGMRFTDAHAPSALCTPTRYGLLTGRYAWRTRLQRGTLVGDSRALIEPGRTTVASFLRGRGYATAGVGKWHLGLGDVEPADYTKPLRPGPLDCGFDRFFGIPASLDMAPYLFFEGDRAVEPPTGRIGASEMRRKGGGGFWRAGGIAPGFTHEGCLPALVAWAEEFLRRQEPAKPFFLYFPLTAPHTPWMPLKGFRGKSGADWYGDFVAQVDDALGRVLRVLEEKKLSENTLVLFMSDNGAHWLPEDIEKHRHRANGPWRGQKGDIWEGGHRVPLIVRWPGCVKAGSTSEALVCLTDLMATVAEIVGGDLPRDAAEDSSSFLPVLLGKGPAPRRGMVLHSGDGGFAIRDGPWKLCLTLGSRGFSNPKDPKPVPGGPKGQLYHLGDDPSETRNLYLEKPAEVARLEAILEKARSEGRTRP